MDRLSLPAAAREELFWNELFWKWAACRCQGGVVLEVGRLPLPAAAREELFWRWAACRCQGGMVLEVGRLPLPATAREELFWEWAACRCEGGGLF